MLTCKDLDFSILASMSKSGFVIVRLISSQRIAPLHHSPPCTWKFVTTATFLGPRIGTETQVPPVCQTSPCSLNQPSRPYFACHPGLFLMHLYQNHHQLIHQIQHLVHFSQLSMWVTINLPEIAHVRQSPADSTIADLLSRW